MAQRCEVLFDGCHVDWSVVILLKAGIEVPGIRYLSVHDQVAVQVPMNVTTIMAHKSTGMDWDVGHDQASQEVRSRLVEKSSPDVLKVFRIVLHWIAVMVTANQDLAAIEAAKGFQALAGKEHVTEVVDSVCLCNGLVPVFYQCLVHLLDRGEWAHRVSVWTNKGHHLGVTKMSV